jgi:uncharacterized protein
MPGHTAKLMLRFIDRIRVAAAHDTECESDQNPLQRAYEVCVSKLSDEERGKLVRIINKSSQQLEGQELWPIGHQTTACAWDSVQVLRTHINTAPPMLPMWLATWRYGSRGND